MFHPFALLLRLPIKSVIISVDSLATHNYKIDFPLAKLFSPVDELCIASHTSSLFSCILWESLFKHHNQFVRPSLKPNHTDDNSSSNTVFSTNLKVLFIKDLLQRLIDMFAKKVLHSITMAFQELPSDVKQTVYSMIDMFAEKVLHSIMEAYQEVPHGAKKKIGGPWQFIVIEKANGFVSCVHTEHKYEITRHLQSRKHVCGMIGSDFDDIPALKKANIRIASCRATVTMICECHFSIQ
ncbi:hypothetical protein FXO37_04283 [Capsicum annuum]|nr:hypothetical protein FXO37_04283 [Capsicum annuum]